MRCLTSITRLLVASYAISKSGAFTGSFVRRGDSMKCCRPRSRQTSRVKRGKSTSLPLSMALEVKIRIVGRKGAEKWLDDGYAMYEKRLRPAGINVQTHYHKNDNDLVKGVTADEDKNHEVVLLDPLGRMSTSEKFSDDLYNWFDKGGSRLTFVIGGAEGLPYELRGDPSEFAQQQEGSDYDYYRQGGAGATAGSGRGHKPPKNMISLSPMTFTHQFARTVLIEQIYRASEFRKGSGYHK